jgi:hypothetical protein
LKTFLSFRETAPNRRILCGFTYVERVGKTKAHKKLWAGETDDRTLDASAVYGFALRNGASLVLDPGAVDYVSVREAQLCLREDNLLLYDMDASKPMQAWRDMRTMRSAGFRLVVVTMGHYRRSGEDEERRLDHGLKTQLEQIAHLLPRPSARITEAQTWAIQRRLWQLDAILPPLLRADSDERAFLETVRSLSDAPPLFAGEAPPLSHRVELGLALPDHRARLSWLYVVKPENALAQFHAALAANLAALDLACPTVHHMKGGQWVRPWARPPMPALPRCRPQ